MPLRETPYPCCLWSGKSRTDLYTDRAATPWFCVAALLLAAGCSSCPRPVSSLACSICLLSRFALPFGSRAIRLPLGEATPFRHRNRLPRTGVTRMRGDLSCCVVVLHRYCFSLAGVYSPLSRHHSEAPMTYRSHSCERRRSKTPTVPLFHSLCQAQLLLSPVSSSPPRPSATTLPCPSPLFGRRSIVTPPSLRKHQM